MGRILIGDIDIGVSGPTGPPGPTGPRGLPGPPGGSPSPSPSDPTDSEDPEICFPLNMWVFGANGNWLRMGDLKPGDILISPKGPREVVGLHALYPMVDVQTLAVITLINEDGEECKIECTPNHSLWLGDRFGAVKPNFQGRSRRGEIITSKGIRVWSKGYRGIKKKLEIGDKLKGIDQDLTIVGMEIIPYMDGTVTPITGSLITVAYTPELKYAILAGGFYDPKTVDMSNAEDVIRFFEEAL